MIHLLLSALLILLTGQAHGLAHDQKQSACSIVEHAKRFPNREGLNYKTLLVSISIVESSICKNLIGDVSLVLSRRGSPSLGCFQFQLSTARWIISNDPRLSHHLKLGMWQLSQKLLNDISFQVELASRYLEWILIHYGREGLWRWNGSRAWEERLSRSLPLARSLVKACEKEKKEERDD